MNTDTKAIIGTIVAATISLGGLLSVQFAGVNTRIDDVNVRIDDVNVRIDDLRTELIDRIDTLRADLSAEIDTVRADLSADNAEIRNDLRRMDDRLRAVEIAFGKVDQRLETLSNGCTGRTPAPANSPRRVAGQDAQLARRIPDRAGDESGPAALRRCWGR